MHLATDSSGVQPVAENQYQDENTDAARSPQVLP
jgi:hypothetical protein